MPSCAAVLALSHPRRNQNGTAEAAARSVIKMYIYYRGFLSEEEGSVCEVTLQERKCLI